MEEQIRQRIAELKEEHARLWSLIVASDAWRRLQTIEGGLTELERLLPKEEALPSGE